MEATSYSLRQVDCIDRPESVMLCSIAHCDNSDGSATIQNTHVSSFLSLTAQYILAYDPQTY